MTAYNDIALVAYLGAACWYLWEGLRTDSPWSFALSGLLAGFAFSVKYTGMIAVVAVLLAIAHKYALRRSALRPMAYALGAFLIPCTPWIVTNWLTFGNPAFPFFNSLFPNPFIHQRWEKEYMASMRSFNEVNWASIPMELTMRGHKLSGLIGPLFLLTPFALWSVVRTRAGRYLGIWLAICLAVYSANIGARLFIPSLFFVSLLLAAVFRSTPVALVLVMGHAFLSWPANMSLYCDPWAYRIDPVKAVRAVVYPSGQDYLRAQSGFRTASFVEAHTPPNAVVFSLTGIDRAYTTRRVVMYRQSAKAEVLEEVILSANRLESTRTLVCTLPRPVSELTIAGRAAPTAELTLTDVSFSLNGAVVKGVKAAVAVNPWEIGLALDDNTATRWRSWSRGTGPIAIKFAAGNGARFDQLAIALATDEGADQWKVVRGPDGYSCGQAPPGGPLPRKDIRAAIAGLGVTHVLLDTEDAFSQYFVAAVRENLKVLASEGSLQLYEVSTR
ncbi:MAG: glycosyltransferase family 39 protein [Acidobacteria bacterium]|nr:glycosyltransferase family 39 protein [Acidobacteriota bacterium]